MMTYALACEHPVSAALQHLVHILVVDVGVHCTHITRAMHTSTPPTDLALALDDIALLATHCGLQVVVLADDLHELARQGCLLGSSEAGTTHGP